MIGQKPDVCEWIMKNLDNAIDQAENRNPTLCKCICFHLYEDNPNIGLSDKDQELLGKLKLLDFMVKEKSKSRTPFPNPSGSSTKYNKPAMDIPPVYTDRS
jgi:hypothetical protein